MLIILLSLLGLVMGTGLISMWWVNSACLFILCFSISSLGYVEGGYFFNASHGLMNDLLSWGLVYLTLWIGALMFAASVGVFVNRAYLREFSIVVLLLLLSLIVVFLVGDMLWFYVFFEASLIPTMFLITGWGYQPERLSAGVYLFFYTMSGSLPLLLSILHISGTFMTCSFHLFQTFLLSSMLLSGALMAAFLIKMPLFLVHLWLPKAHVEAPISGSMVLAGVLLKLGGYGLLRVMKLICTEVMSVGSGLLVLSLVGGLMISLLCLRQYDLKSLIAYSSVVHMGLVIGGLMVMSYWGAQGALVLMIGHGLCSSGLFANANIFYERGGTRSLVLNKGLMSAFPSIMFLWFMLCVSNMAAPPSLNLLGEISLMISLVSWSSSTVFLLAGMSFFSAAYSLFLFSLVSHGKAMVLFGSSDISVREYLVLMLHWLPLNVLILKADLVFSWLYFE